MSRKAQHRNRVITPAQLYLTAANVAEMIGVSPRTVLGWHQGRPGAPGFPAPCKLLQKSPRWRRSDIVAWMEPDRNNHGSTQEASR